MGELKVDYDVLGKRIGYLFELYLKLGEEVEKIAGYTEHMDIFWAGGANDAYMTALVTDMADIGALLLRIRGAIKAADTVFSAYMQNEAKVRMLISGI